MKFERTKNAKRNIVYGLLNRFLSLVLPFTNRTVFIYVLGVEYLGLNTLFASILQMLSLAELGIGRAIVYHMYKPIAKNNTDMVCALLCLYRRIYRLIGTTIFFLGIIIMPFLSHLISGNIPDGINLYIVYFVYLINTVISYWFFIYKASIINAMQRADIISNIASATQIFQCLIQICLLYLTHNYYAYLIIMPFATLFNNILLSYCTERMFPQYKCRGKVSISVLRDLKEKVLGLLIQNFCVTTRNGLDSICLSYFIGLSITGIFNNYFYVLTAITSICAIFTSGITAIVGNSMVTYDSEKNYQDMRRLNTLYMFFSGACSIFMLIFYQPFMRLWVGDSMMLPMDVVILFVLYFYILKMGDVRSVYVGGAGLWWENRYRSIVETLSNLILNVVFVMYFGVYGILLATIVSLFFINFLWGSHIVFHHYFRNGKVWEYFLDHGKYFAVFSISAWISWEVSLVELSSPILSIIYKLLSSSLVICLSYYLLYRKSYVCHESIQWFMDKMGMSRR